MKKHYLSCLFAALAFFMFTHAYASATEWEVDQAHSGGYFRIAHIYSSVKGFFPDFEGSIKFDPSNLDESRIAFNVKVKSVDTNNSKRDGHLLTNEFFDAKKFPEMSFESQSIKHLEANNYQVTGKITVKDVSKTITIPFIYFGFKQHPLNPKLDVAGFEASLNIDRLEYNVGNGKYYKLGAIGKDVDVLISIEATKQR